MTLTDEATRTGWGTFSSGCVAEISYVSMETEGVWGSELSMWSAQSHNLHTYLS